MPAQIFVQAFLLINYWIVVKVWEKIAHPFQRVFEFWIIINCYILWGFGSKTGGGSVSLSVRTRNRPLCWLVWSAVVACFI